MLVETDINGEKIKVQIVKKRNGTVYIRKYNDNIPPSPAQMEVRKRLAIAAINKFGAKREEVIESVKNAVAPVVTPRVLNETEQNIASVYPTSVTKIVRKMVPVRIKKPVEFHENLPVQTVKKV